MYRAMMAAVALLVALPAARAETPAAPPALAEAMSGFYVVLPADTASGNPVTEVRRDADGSNPRNVVVAFIDPEDAKTEIVAAGLGDVTEGRIVSGADLYAATAGDVIWRTTAVNAAITDTSRDDPPVFYVVFPNGNSVTQQIDGAFKVVFYLDAEAAEGARTGMMASLSASGQPSDLQVMALSFTKVMAAIMKGQVADAQFATAPNVERWLEQREAGAVLIRDYKSVQDEAFEAISNLALQ